MIPVRSVLVFMLAVLLAACGGNREDPGLTATPPGGDSLISPERMALILSDIHIAEAAMTLERNAGNPANADPAFYYRGIFEKHHVTAALYARNISWYRQNPDQLVKVYDRVIAILENRQKSLFPGR